MVYEAAVYSDDDLGWLFADRMLPWENLGLKSTDACVVDLVDFWMEQGNQHVRINYFRSQLGLEELGEVHMPMLLRFVSEVRWRKRGRPW